MKDSFWNSSSTPPLKTEDFSEAPIRPPASPKAMTSLKAP